MARPVGKAPVVVRARLVPAVSPCVVAVNTAGFAMVTVNVTGKDVKTCTFDAGRKLPGISPSTPVTGIVIAVPVVAELYPSNWSAFRFGTFVVDAEIISDDTDGFATVKRETLTSDMPESNEPLSSVTTVVVTLE